LKQPHATATWGATTTDWPPSLKEVARTFQTCIVSQRAGCDCDTSALVINPEEVDAIARLTNSVQPVNHNGAPIAGCAPQLPPEGDPVARHLSALFDKSEVKFKPAAISGNRALALAYVDVRAIQNRLDEVCGVAGWHRCRWCAPAARTCHS
jgi:hypothetical protein